jgi:diguanylate cyclase (GGDEF)-like protein/PAS domain S-box-containing protein
LKTFLIHPSHASELRPVFSLLVLMLLLIFNALLLPAPDASRGLANYLPLHITLEMLAIAVAAMVFAVGWSTQKYNGNGNVAWLACMFLAVAILDFSHTLSYPGMPDFVTPGDPEKAINFWLAARSFAAVGLLGAAVMRWQSPLYQHRRALLAAVLLLVALLHYLFLFQPERLPRTFVAPDGLTAFKIGFEYLLIATYLLAALLFLLKLSKPRQFNATSLFAVAALMAMSEFFFTLYANVTDSFNLLGHVYKILAYGFLYRALFVETVELPWRKLSESERQLNATMDALPDLLFELDEAGNYLDVHASESNKLVAPATDLLHRNIRDVMSAEAVDACLSAMREAREKGISRGQRIMLEVPQGRRYFELSVSCRQAQAGEPLRYLVLSRDETETVLQQLALEHEARLNEGLLTLSREASLRDENGFLQYGAERAEYLTLSQRACIYLVNADQQRVERVGCIPNQAEPLPQVLLDLVISRQQPLMLNDAAAAKGVMDGTETCTRMISLPVVESGRVRMLVNVGNKETEYSERDLNTLQILADSLWQLVRRQRQDRAIETLSSALAQSPNSVVITDLNGDIEYVNEAFVRSSGYQPEDVIGHNPSLIKSGKTPDEVYSRMWAQLKRGQTWQGELINRRKDGTEYYERVLIYPVRDAEGHVVNYISHKEDISTQKAADARIMQLSNYDQLTQLPNRTLLEERFNHALDIVRRHHEPLTLIWLDLDNFKAVNDVMGHAAGDQLLREVADRIRARLQDQDTLSRQSGDSFIIVLPSAGQDSAALKAAELLQALEPVMQLNDQELSVGASLGLALYPNDGETLDALLMCAEAAMYQVKQQGRNNFRFYAPEMQAHTSRSLALSNALKHSLPRGELHLVYQPQYSFQRKAMVAAEVLLRWDSPEWGSVSPAEFIPMAERSGLIIPVGEWVVREAASQLAKWQQQGLAGLTLAINLSAVQFNQPDLVRRLSEIVREEGIQPGAIELELTEAAALQDPEAASGTMQQLRQAGFHLSIDDFGTGYSSMSYLKRFSVDKLKIDQSFVRELEQSHDDLAIVTAISQMAHSLGMITIAEGVETRTQAKLLKQQGCDEIQGYLYSRPLSAEQFLEFAHRPDKGF